MYNSHFLHLTLWLEQIPDKGEDAVPTVIADGQAGIITVYDGLGGAGSKRYHLENGQEVSGAYIASRLAKQILEDFYIGYWAAGVDTLAEDLREGFAQKLKELHHQPSKLRSKLIKQLPTTIAGIHYELDEENLLHIHSFWAGDSRAYLQTQAGIIQISKDDLVGKPDALESLVNDAKINNCLSAKGEFSIWERQLVTDEPLLMLVASDGCFDYLPSPAHFEYLLLHTLMQSHYDLDDWQDKLQETLSSIAADDCSLALVAWQFESLEAIKSFFLPRYQSLKTQYIEPLEQLNGKANFAEIRSHLWDSYQRQYYLH